jgi:hypothetical protein
MGPCASRSPPPPLPPWTRRAPPLRPPLPCLEHSWLSGWPPLLIFEKIVDETNISDRVFGVWHTLNWQFCAQHTLLFDLVWCTQRFDFTVFNTTHRRTSFPLQNRASGSSWPSSTSGSDPSEDLVCGPKDFLEYSSRQPYLIHLGNLACTTRHKMSTAAPDSSEITWLCCNLLEICFPVVTDLDSGPPTLSVSRYKAGNGVLPRTTENSSKAIQSRTECRVLLFRGLN